MHARPVVMFGSLDHGGTHRIELDIPIRGEQVVIRVDQAGLEASFPQRSAASMATVEGSDVSLTQLTHGQRYLARGFGADEQVHMIAHQHVGVDAQAVSCCTFAQQAQIVAAVFVIQKDGAAIDPALRDVERYAGDLKASLARHGRTESSEEPSLRAVSRARYRECRVGRVGNGPVFVSLNFLRPGFPGFPGFPVSVSRPGFPSGFRFPGSMEIWSRSAVRMPCIPRASLQNGVLQNGVRFTYSRLNSGEAGGARA